MSFRLKTILLLILLSLAPYVVAMVLLGNIYRDDVEDRVLADMNYQLATTADQLDNQLNALMNDMHFITSLDIMNDVLSGDFDKRITGLLIAKKKDLKLYGDFFVYDLDNTVVASSDVASLGTPVTPDAFMQVPVSSTFNNEQIGVLAVDYNLVTLEQYLPEHEHQSYRLTTEDVESSMIGVNGQLVVVTRLNAYPGLSLVLSRDKDFAFALLTSLERGFMIILLAGVFIIAGIAYLIASYIVNPILMLSSTAQAITETQDFGKRVTVDRGDEIGQLSVAFNQMVEGIQGMLVQLKEESENKLKLVQEKNRTEMLQNLSTKLSKYLSPQVYESIFSGEKEVALSSSRKKLTIFFSDIVNFTDTTDQMESEDLTLLLNQYLSEMTNIALEYGATIDKYIGDAVMIFFGDPKSQGIEEDAVLCVQMALSMQEKMRELQEYWRRQGFTNPFSIRVGIHTGYCTVGNFGTENRMDYTIVGSAVNLASRIESNAEPDCIYISEATHLLVGHRLSCVPGKSFTPKGFAKPIQLYKVLDPAKSDKLVEITEPGFHLKMEPQEMSAESRLELKDKLVAMLDKI